MAQKIIVFILLILPAHIGYKLGLDYWVGDAYHFEGLFWLGMGVLAISFTFSMLVLFRGSRSLAPLYVLIYGYSAWAISVTVQAGSFDNIYMIFPLLTLLYCILLAKWTGAWHVVLIWTVAAIVLGLAQHWGWIAYGPGYVMPMETVRSSTGWFLVNGLFMVTVFLVTACVLWLITNSRDQALTDLLQSRSLIRRYLPPAVADQIISGEASSIDAPQRRRITIFFSDIAGFTDMADRVEPEVMTEVLSQYMSAMADIVDAHGGTLNEFAGDGLMALFGAPTAMEPAEQAHQAVRAARAMQQAMSGLNEQWRRLGLGTELRSRIGINTSMVSVGSYGSRGRMTYTAIGLQTNIASRIEHAAEPGEILISDATYQLISDAIPCEPRGEVDCKGVHFPVPVYAPGTVA